MGFNILVKIFFFGLIVFVLVNRGLPRFEGKGILFRLFTFPLAAFVVPLFWHLKLKRRPYPHLADALILLPFAIDFFGNAANLYDTVWFFDDLAHFGNWLFLVSGVGILLSLFNLNRLHVSALALGIGSVTHMIWEIGEFIGMKLGVSRLFLTYEDTLTDMSLALAGSLLGAFLSATLFYRK